MPCRYLASACLPSTLPYNLGVGGRLQAPLLYTEGNKSPALMRVLAKVIELGPARPILVSLSLISWSVAFLTCLSRPLGFERVLSRGASLSSGRGQGSAVGQDSVGPQLEIQYPQNSVASESGRRAVRARVQAGGFLGRTGNAIPSLASEIEYEAKAGFEVN